MIHKHITTPKMVKQLLNVIENRIEKRKRKDSVIKNPDLHRGFLH